MSHLPFWIIMLGTVTIIFVVALLANSIRKAYRIFRQEPPPIQIPTMYGPVTEKARRAAALAMRNEPDTMARVLAVLEQEAGSREDAEKLARERYPEAYDR
jgi:hypothetical protein